ncbi:4Fe-4S binding protein [Aneurinibacillus terranovensis]|uniref:4Fe-4S binding protein n=1 Tax=Aneurinibacillus terranovensis TaxID=278991 RepID=UPI000683EF64|nr:4Fe-4S dicluster domain-containing protein [Aneurinibacillus terranovensis]
MNTVPIRYGFLIGFLLVPFFSGSIACAYCDYSFLERLSTGVVFGNIGVVGSTTILTGFFWLVLFGLMTKGGRGYCSFLCPVGSIQSAVHSVGARFGFTYKLRYEKEKCTACSSCVQACPMSALRKEEKEIKYEILNCITCRQCEASCPTAAISYGCGKRGWSTTANAAEHELHPQVQERGHKG